MATLGCKKTAPHLDPRNEASTLDMTHTAADKLESAENKQNEELEKLGQ